jgi:hypothetical protein
METSNNKEFLHGLQEYCRYKGSTETETKVKQVLDILYSDDVESAVINFLLSNYEGPNTRYFRFVRDFVKSGKDLKTLSDALSRSQIRSKIWLVDELEQISKHYDNVVLLAGWYGQLIELFGDSTDKITFSKFRNIEIDKDACYESDYNFNLRRLENHKVKSVHADINNLMLHSTGYEWKVENFKTGEVYTEKFLPNLIINTSAEHMTTEWFDQIRFKPWKEKPIVAIQSNNYFELEEHINCVHSISHMKKIFPMEEVLYEGELQLKGYKRVMLIGKP